MIDLLIRVAPLQGDPSYLLVSVEAGSPLDGARKPAQFHFDLNAHKLDTPDNVASYGRAVCEALAKHDVIDFELSKLFASVGADEACSLKFQLAEAGGEEIRWESLCDKDARYLSLAKKYRLARVATPLKEKDVSRVARLPLKMLAYLSAAGVSAADEFRTLCEQLVQARANGLMIEAEIFVGEERILNEPAIVAGIDPGSLSHISVRPIPLADVLENQVRKGSYQFLHFFCHGVDRGAGLKGLSLATIQNHLSGEQSGGVLLSLQALTEALAENQSAWIAVFNSCSGAAGTVYFNSLAYNVTNTGCPYAIGMAEPVEPGIAAIITKALYGELFTTVIATLPNLPKDKFGTIDLSGVINPARKAIKSYCEAIDPGGPYGRWLTPVIYINAPKPLPVQLQQAVTDALGDRREIADQKMLERINIIASALRVLPGDAPPEVRDQIFALLDKAPAVPIRLRPNKNGEFISNGAAS